LGVPRECQEENEILERRSLGLLEVSWGGVVLQTGSDSVVEFARVSKTAVKDNTVARVKARRRRIVS
jgi:hypothetical protein